MTRATAKVLRKTAVVCQGLVVAVILQSAAALADTRCPTKDFFALRGSDITESTAILAFGADLNGDGVKEVFLAREEDINGKAGNMWMVYVSQGDQFHLSKQIPSVRPDDVLKLRKEGSRVERLFQVSSPSRGTLAILEVAVSGSAISQRVIASIAGFKDEDADTIHELLGGKGTEAVRVIRGKSSDFSDCGLDQR